MNGFASAQASASAILRRTEKCTSDLGLAAAKRALEHAGMSAEDIDLIVVATTTPDYTFPSTATIIQHGLGIERGAAFDIQAVCSGFIYGLNVVDALLKTGSAKNALLIGAETFSRILDWEDRTTCVLFGDGAGAVVLSAEECPGRQTSGAASSTVLSAPTGSIVNYFMSMAARRKHKPWAMCA